MTTANTKPALPNPGSREAAAAGCTCPVIDNHHGKGFPAPWGGPEKLFVFAAGCPVHDAGAARQPKEAK